MLASNVAVLGLFVAQRVVSLDEGARLDLLVARLRVQLFHRQRRRPLLLLPDLR